MKRGFIGTSRDDATVVTAMVGTMFPHKKFIVKDEELAYGGVLATKFCEKLMINKEIRKSWWQGAKQLVRKSIDKKRNAVSQAIKEEFMRKCSLVRCECFSKEQN